MIYSQQDKKLVDQYKLTNIALRKQLNNLNNEIDRILIKRSNKIGLQKLPNVSKHITDPNVMQHQIQNMKKRLQLLERDALIYKNKAAINYYQQIKQIQGRIRQRDQQIEDNKKMIRDYERKDKIADVQASKQTSKVDKKISHLQQQIGRYQKLQKDLTRQISAQQANQFKKNNYLQQLAAKHLQANGKKEKKIPSPPKQPIQQKPQASIDQEQWKNLKKQFLIFKQGKQNQEYALNEQNQSLRTEIKEWEKKIKEKKKKISAINQINQKSRQSRIYSTLNPTQSKQVKSYRYRDKSNSIQYNTKQ